MSQLHYYRDLTKATLDYLTAHYSKSIIVDGRSYIGEYYAQQQLQADKYFQRKATSLLKKQFERLVDPLRKRGDQAFARFISERTNQEFDIFKELNERVRQIVARNKISSLDEVSEVSTVLNIHQRSGADPAYEEMLKGLLQQYLATHHELQYKDQLKTADKNNDRQEIISPDGRKRLHISRWRSGKSSSTTVSIIFEHASTGIYGKTGIDPVLTAAWKDNGTILISTGNEGLNEDLKYRTVQSFDEIVNIEYVEL